MKSNDQLLFISYWSFPFLLLSKYFQWIIYANINMAWKICLILMNLKKE